MQDRAFFDTNILIYLFSSDDEPKKSLCIQHLKTYEPFISTQVINELCNVFTKKFKLSSKSIENTLVKLENYFNITVVDLPIINKALEIHKFYGYSYFDSLMISSAIKSGSKYLFSEDMQDGQTIDGVIIKNIFK